MQSRLLKKSHTVKQTHEHVPRAGEWIYAWTYYLHAKVKGLIRSHLKNHGAGPFVETGFEPSSESLGEEEAAGLPLPWYCPNARDRVGEGDAVEKVMYK